MFALFAIVPLSVWAATGRWRAALEAAKGYGLWWAIVGAGMLTGAVIGWVCALLDINPT